MFLVQGPFWKYTVTLIIFAIWSPLGENTHGRKNIHFLRLSLLLNLLAKLLREDWNRSFNLFDLLLALSHSQKGELHLTFPMLTLKNICHTEEKILVGSNSLMSKITILYSSFLFNKRYHSEIVNPELRGPEAYMIWRAGCLSQ